MTSDRHSSDSGVENAGLYRRVARTAVRASPIFIGSVLLFIAAVAVGQLATGTFDHSLAGLVEGVLAAMFIGLPAYLTAIAIAHAVLMEHTEVTP